MKNKIIHSINDLVCRISDDIIDEHEDLSSLVLIGIVTKGYPLAQRISKKILEKTKEVIPVAKLDITLYRDDLGLKGHALQLHETDISSDLTGKDIILVDDVFFRGRTARAAIEAVLDHGRPKRIELAILIDRGYRELPIFANYTGITMDTNEKGQIKVLLQETDGEDKIIIND
ncbi:MAG: bifunctional pyr operon transcriptional regulator/uracil phosphoribosyltransferase PyrR [Candidatus Margulisbacteria bacterium]|nr:bifunctional pyr operon transcriptional regulator/uracil phosphoribosyltransferase PyrR [Candidatus Margulisiibacteriota bacterium]